MPHGAVAVEFVALILAEDERYLDAILGDVTAMKTVASVSVRPALGELSGISSGLSPIEPDAVDNLDRATSVNVATKEDIHTTGPQQLP